MTLFSEFVSFTPSMTLFSAVYDFWRVKEIVELANGPTGCGEVAKGGCLFA